LSSRPSASPECEKRKQRINFFLQKLGRVSKSELDVIDLTVRLIEAEHNKAMARLTVQEF
jgi:hypothetical protein